MDYRQVTPPSALELEDHRNLQCPGGSASTNATTFTNNWSPESVMTAATTPPKSPHKIRGTGPMLLPRVRAQDHILEPAVYPSHQGHFRTISLPSNAYPMQFGPTLPPAKTRPDTYRRSTSPPEEGQLPTPASLRTPHDPMMLHPAGSRRSSLAQSRSRSTSNIHCHSRNSSSSSIDASIISRFGYPTYRQSPTPQPQSQSHMMSMSVPKSRAPSAMNHLAPIAMPGGQMQSYPARRRTTSPPANPSKLSVEMDFDPALDEVNSSMLEYLTKPNPTPALTQRISEPSRAQQTHFWFDVRNIRSWSDFNVDTISAIPGLLQLLRVDLPLRQLPEPGRVSLNPETQSQLAELCATHHGVKVNAALQIAQGKKHMVMRSLKPSVGARQQPEFVSNYQSDAEKTIYGDGRGRVVGIVRCFDQWNSGMRNESPAQKVKYMQSLANLHRYMREHGCRYGFIMTEIELVCVRAGGAATKDSDVPLFGFLELATPIQLAAHGTAESGKLQMTAGLALWYLHMLAKEQPLPGQYSWRMEVGGPAALTRQRHLPRDDWMPKPVMSEKREAKRARGWVFPDEALSKRECGRGRRPRK